MKIKKVYRNVVLSICYILIIATFIISCDWTQRDANTRKEIATVEEQIRQIDKKIADLIWLSQPAGPGSIVLNYNAEISQLKSEREMLIVKLTALYRSLK